MFQGHKILSTSMYQCIDVRNYVCMCVLCTCMCVRCIAGKKRTHQYLFNDDGERLNPQSHPDVHFEV
ncbi:unnamed protein product [Onchocerca flexuosa]|uniref:Ovule protein n=1 Tax=Onchocerca flexuosa TaxID=387005 RepID=A0A183GYV5_9BILA|nr:unnamed protein product [Onchocerca flexuosa]